jgi:tripartite-type tricarboxylate transporter receptor subunit TctC
MPDMPTFDEAGVSGYDVTNWFGVMAPKGTPRDVVELLNRHIGQAAEDPPVVQKLAAAGILPMRESVEQFQKRVNADYAKWRDIVREAGVKIQ